MDKKSIWGKWFWIGLIFLALLVGFGFESMQMKTKQFQYTKIEGSNPLIGYAVNATNPNAVGDRSLVYVQLSFREWEPEKNAFAVESVKEKYSLDRWKEEGKHVVFRFVCDVPGQEPHMDIPDWLYEETQDGKAYDMSYGKGYSPNYENEVFIKEHEKAIHALGDAFGRDSFFAYIELGSIGHWGEWHVKYDAGIPRLPKEETLINYVTPYTKAFPNAKLLMRRPFSFGMEQGMGVYNDMTGDPQSTDTWLTWIREGGSYEEPKKPLSYTAMPEIWENAPVGGEFTSGISMENLLIQDLEQTLPLLKSSHMSFLGPKCPCHEECEGDYENGYMAVLDSLGYQYSIQKASIRKKLFAKKLEVQLMLTNYGVAPIYFQWPLVYKAEYTDGTTEEGLCEADLTQIGAGKTEKVCFFVSNDKAVQAIYVGVMNPDTKACEMKLYMDAKQKDGMYCILGN